MLFALGGIAAVAVAFRGTRQSPAVVTAVVLAVAVALAMHARLALGRWRATAFVVASGLGLLVLGASPRLAGGIMLLGVVASELIARGADRAAVLRAALLTGATAGVVSLSGLVTMAPLSFETIARDAAVAVIGCVMSAPLLLTFGPVAEWIFGHTTRLTLNERLNFTHPLLRDLATHAPGTFQHSVNVSVLASRAAEAIAADSLLTRVGGLYHDVGKIRAPGYFIENQRGENPHNQLAPWDSADIFRQHVTDGLRLAAEYRLGVRVAAIVREHHGTGLMRSLVAKAATLQVPPEENYRYDGPRPRSRESAIVMMADQIEATARSEPPADAAAAKTIVSRTIERIVADGELQDSALSERQRRLVAGAFEEGLQAMFHSRLTYPEQQQPPKASAETPKGLFSRRWGRRSG